LYLPSDDWGETCVSAVWKNVDWFHVQGRTNTSIYGHYPLNSMITTPAPSNIVFSEKVLQELQHLKDTADTMCGVGLKKINIVKPNFSTPFIYPYRLFPCLNILIESKVDLTTEAVGQAILYSATSLIASTYYSMQPGPTINISVISNGNSYVFQVFRLNTLDFSPDSPIKNEVWVSDVMPVFSISGKINPTPFSYLYYLLSYLYAQQRYCHIQKSQSPVNLFYSQ